MSARPVPPPACSGGVVWAGGRGGPTSPCKRWAVGGHHTLRPRIGPQRAVAPGRCIRIPRHFLLAGGTWRKRGGGGVIVLLLLRTISVWTESVLCCGHCSPSGRPARGSPSPVPRRKYLYRRRVGPHRCHWQQPGVAWGARRRQCEQQRPRRLAGCGGGPPGCEGAACHPASTTAPRIPWRLQPSLSQLAARAGAQWQRALAVVWAGRGRGLGCRRRLPLVVHWYAPCPTRPTRGRLWIVVACPVQVCCRASSRFFDAFAADCEQRTCHACHRHKPLLLATAARICPYVFPCPRNFC